MVTSRQLLLPLFTWLPTIAGFLVESQVRTITSTTPFYRCPSAAVNRIETSQNLLPDAVSTMVPSSTIMTADALEVVKSVVIGAAGIGIFLFGLAFVFSTWLIPQAAKQLEDQAKSVDPALWQEYEARLEPGETLAMRPELIQELGEKVRTKMAQQFDAALARQEEAKASSNADDGILDATILSKDETKKD